MTLPYGRNSCNSTELYNPRLSIIDLKNVLKKPQETMQNIPSNGKKWIKSSSLKKKMPWYENGSVILWRAGPKRIVSAKVQKAWAADGYGSAWHTIPRHWHSAGCRPRETRPPACQQKVKAYNKPQVGCFQNRETPQNGWFIMEIPIKMDDLGGKPTIFGNPHLEVLKASDWSVLYL